MNISTMPKRQELNRNADIVLATRLLANVRDYQLCHPFGPNVYFDAMTVAGALHAFMKDSPLMREWFDAAVDAHLAELAAERAARRKA